MDFEKKTTSFLFGKKIKIASSFLIIIYVKVINGDHFTVSEAKNRSFVLFHLSYHESGRRKPLYCK
jgi:hypothetical protein